MPGAGRVFNKAIRREVAHVAKITSVDDALPEKPFRASLEHVIFVVSIPLLLLGFGLFSETAHFLSWFLSSVLYVCIGVLSFVAYFEIGANLRKALQHDYSESIASQRKNLALVGYYSYQGLSLGLTTIPLFYLLLVTGMVQAADACILEPSKDSVCVTGFIGFEDPMAPFARLYQALLFTADTVARGALLHLSSNPTILAFQTGSLTADH